MGNDLEVSTGQQQIAVRTPELVKKVSDLEKGGYYRNVKSPEEYLSVGKKEGSQTSDELEIYDDSDDGKVEKKSLSPLKHWNARVKKKYDECTDSQKEAWLDSFKIIEKGYVKQLNDLKEDLQMAAPIIAMMEPFKKDLEKLNISAVEYLRGLITYDKLLGKNPVYEIARLISVFNVQYADLYDALMVANKDVADEASVDKYVAPLRDEIAQLKESVGYDAKTVEAKKAADDISEKITTFFEQLDAEGKPRYPGAFDNIKDIVELVQIGEGLEDAYNIVINGERKAVANNEVEYEEHMDEKKGTPLNALQKEKQMLLNTLKRITQ
jgi:hypothetical protein